MLMKSNNFFNNIDACAWNYCSNYYEDDDIFRLIAANYSNPTVGFHNRLTHRNYDEHQKM